MLGLLMTAATSIFAESDVNRTSPYTLVHGYGEQANPWAVPQKQSPRKENHPNTWSAPKYYDTPYGGERRGDEPTQGRFVTPDILQSLKQQQMQTQRAPVENYYRQSKPQPRRQQQYGLQPYGMSYSQPIYDTPSVSPWASSPDLFYQGQSFPMVPDEAIGGLPPIQMPLFGNDDLSMGNRPNIQKESDVFNPFTFIPNGDLH